MSTIDYKALAERLSRLADERASLIVAPHIADIRTVVTLLHMLGGQTTVPDNSQEWSRLDGIAAFLLIERHADGWADAGKMMEEWRVARSHPAPQPRPVLSGYGDYGAAIPGIERPCTCHPDDNPPVPCAQKYALNECSAAQGEPTEAQIVAVANVLLAWEAEISNRVSARVLAEDAIRAALAAKD